MSLAAAGALSRLSGRGGGTTFPGRVLNALDSSAIGTPGRAPAGGLRDRLGDERQDDDGSHGGGHSGIRALDWPGTPPAPTSPRASRRRSSRSTAPSWACSRWTRRRCRGSPRRSSRARSVSATSSATSSTATASWRSWPSAGASVVAALPAASTLIVNEDDPQLAQIARGRARRAPLRARRRAPRRRPPPRRRRALLQRLRTRLRIPPCLRRPPRRLLLPWLRLRAHEAGRLGRARSRSTASTGSRFRLCLPEGDA